MSTIEIPLLHGRVMLIDDVDLPRFESRPWHAIPARSTFYGQAGDDTSVLAHRLVLDAPKGTIVDHANRNGLDNRRGNLRLCTDSQNHANSPKQKNNTSGYKGVSRARSGRWVANVTVDKVQRYLGTFTDPWGAAEAYNEAALEAWGEFAYLNTRMDGSGL